MLIFHLHVVFALTTILRTRSDVADRGRGVYCFFLFQWNTRRPSHKLSSLRVLHHRESCRSHPLFRCLNAFPTVNRSPRVPSGMSKQCAHVHTTL